MKKQPKSSKAKKWLLAIGIAIIFTMFVNYGITTFYEEPQYQKYCERKVTILNWTQENCIEQGGQWTTYPAEKYAYYGEGAPVAIPSSSGYCDPDFTCRKNLEEATKKFEDKAFIIMVIGGFIGLVLGVILINGAVSSGFLLGGIITLFFATVRYWARFQNWSKFIILGIVLIILVWIAYKKTR